MQRRPSTLRGCKFNSRFVATYTSETPADSPNTHPVQETSGTEVPLCCDPVYGLPALNNLFCTLQQCRKGKSPSLGLSVYFHTCIHGLESLPVLGNYLVPMLVDCANLGLAQQVFNRLATRNEYSWTALMQGYYECGMAQHALSLFALMIETGVDPSGHSYVVVLKCCAKLSCTQIGLSIHTALIKDGLDKKLLIGNALLFTYAKCGLKMEAWKVFMDLPSKDTVSWSALIAGLTECSLCEEALACFRQMQMEGVWQDGITYIHCLKACGDMKSANKGHELHLEIMEQGLEVDSYVKNTLLDMYMKCGSLMEAQEVFDRLPVHDVVSWTAIIVGYAEHGFDKELLTCFDQMQSKGVSPNKVTYVGALHACIMAGNIKKGLELHIEILKKGYELEIPIGGYLVNVYSRCGFLQDAQLLFEKLSDKDVGSWNSLVGGYAEYGFADEAYAHFQQMQSEGISPDIVSWNNIISGFAEQKQTGTTFGLFLQMQEQGLLPNNMTFVSILKACGDMSALMHGRRLHIHLHKSSILEATDINLTTALFDMYGRCGSMGEAQQVFDELSSRDLVAWNALITGYGYQGETDFIFPLFNRLQEELVYLDAATFLSLLNACNHRGCLQEGYHFFDCMRNEYGLTPSIRHFNCMLDLHGRAGCHDEVVIVLEHMPFRPDLAVWNSVTSALNVAMVNESCGKR